MLMLVTDEEVRIPVSGAHLVKELSSQAFGQLALGITPLPPVAGSLTGFPVDKGLRMPFAALFHAEIVIPQPVRRRLQYATLGRE